MEKSAEAEHPRKAFGWAARDSSGILSPFHFSRRANGDNDVTLKILFCGICHTDVHMTKNDHGISMYPMVPGHEIAGVATEVGRNVKKFKVGDKVGVGCFVGACHACDNCEEGLESYCPKLIYTYGGVDHDGTITQGGYSDIVVTNERYVVRFPDNLPLDAGAPLLCAGITVYSPMQYFGINKPGMHLGVVGLGGLGHVAVKYGKAFGMKVTVISTSPSKEKEAIERLGADAFLISHDDELMQGAMGTMDGIIDTVSASHPVAPLIGLLKSHGKLVMVGVSDKPLEVPAIPLLVGKWTPAIRPLLMGRKLVAGSAAGGMKEVQEMIDFSAKHNITADIEIIPIGYVNTAMERLAKGDVRYRFVIDVANTLIA